MGIMLDILVLGLIIIFTIVGLKRGFAKEVIEFIIAIVLIPVCIILMNPVASIITNTTNVDKTINMYIVENVVKLKGEEEVKESENKQGLLEVEINKIIKENKDKGIEEIANIAGKNITDGIIKGIAFIAIYLILSLIILIFKSAILGIIENIGIFKGTNSILGGVFGAIKALLVVYIILTVVQIASIAGKDKTKDIINETMFVKEIEKFNPITGLILKK